MPVSESITGLCIGHLNVYHLFHKVADVSLLLNQSSQLTHLFRISETRLDSRINSNSIRIPDYRVMRRDNSKTLIDHIHTNNQTMVSEVLVSTASISDHGPIFCI